MRTRALLAVILACLVAALLAAEPALAEKNPLREVYFGETHVHTNWSFDAYIFGNTNTGPAEAYKYGLGEPIKHPMGYTIQITHPLDWMGVTDLELAQANRGAMVALGIVCSLCVVMSLLAGQAAWARVAVRVAGSWIAAAGLFMLGWAVRGA